ncbi:MAG TPA: hypothetical protein VK619_10065 [Pyrinomonadaceae bacterium]|nr:hypothetical protein [Pyrinomonadaceae bacterium]
MSDAIWEVIADGGLPLPRRHRPRADRHVSRGLVETLQSLNLSNVSEVSIEGEFSLPHEGAYNADGWVRGKLILSGQLTVKREGSQAGTAISLSGESLEISRPSGVAVELGGEGVEISGPLASHELFGGEFSLEGSVHPGEFARAVASGNRRRIARALLGGVSLGVKWEEAGVEIKLEPDEDILLVEVAITPTLFRNRNLLPFRYHGIPCCIEGHHLTTTLKLGPGNQLLRVIAEEYGPQLVALVAEEGSMEALTAWATIGVVGSLAFTYGLISYLDSQHALGEDEGRMHNFASAYVETAFSHDRRSHRTHFEPGVSDGELRAVADILKHGQAHIQRLLAAYFNNRRVPNDLGAIGYRMGIALINHRDGFSWYAHGLDEFTDLH